MSDQAPLIDPNASDGYDEKGHHYTISYPSADTITLTYDDGSTVTERLDGQVVSESVVNPPSPSDPPGTPPTRTDYWNFDKQNQPHAASGPDGPNHQIVAYTIDYNPATGERTEHFPTHTVVFDRAGNPETDSGTDPSSGLHYDTTFSSSGETTTYANGDVYQYAADGRPTYQKVVSPPPEGAPPNTPDTVTTYTDFEKRPSDGKWVPKGAGSDNVHGDFTISNDWAAGTSTRRYTTTDLTVVTGTDGHTVSETGTDDNGHYFTTFTTTGSTTTYDSGPAKGSVYQYNVAGDPVFQKVVSPPPKGSPPGTPDTVTTYTSFQKRASDGKWVPTAGSDNVHGAFTITYDTAAGTSTTQYTTTDLTVVTGADGHPVSETGTDDNGHFFTTFTTTGSTTTYDSGPAKGSVYQYNVDGDPVFQKVVSPPPKGSPPGTPDTVTTFTSFQKRADGTWVPTGGSDNVNGDFTISYDWAAGTETVSYKNGAAAVFDGDGRILSSTVIKTDADGNKVAVTTTFDYNRPNGQYVATTGDEHTLFDGDGNPIKIWKGNDESTAELYTPGLNGHYYLTDPDGTKTEYDINGRPITTWDSTGKVVVDWGAQPDKLEEAWRAAKLASEGIEDELTGLRTVFNSMRDVWSAPSYSTFDPLAESFMTEATRLQGVLAEAVKRLYDTYQNILTVETTNAATWGMGS